MTHAPAGEASIGASHGHGGVTTRFYIMVWLGLVVVTAIEVYLAYIHLKPVTMLILLLGLSLVKAALITSYFMHLRFERFSLVLWLIPALLFCIGMMTIFFGDASILRHMRE